MGTSSSGLPAAPELRTRSVRKGPDGTTPTCRHRKVWLSEAEIAEAYRARFTGLADRVDRVGRIETRFLNRLNAEQVFVVVTLVPDLPVLFTIDNDSLRAFTATYLHQRVSGMGIPVTRVPVVAGPLPPARRLG
jgi:hypothetical protein